MEAIKKFVNVVAMLYLIAATLIYLDILNVGQDANPNFNTTLLIVGGAILLLELLTENLYITSLKRGHVHTEHKINELKALLYDQKQEMQHYKSSRSTEESINRPPANASSVSSPAVDRNTIIVKPGSISGNSNPGSGSRGSSDSI